MLKQLLKRAELMLGKIEPIITTIFIYVFGQAIGGLVVYIILGLLGWSPDRITDWLSEAAAGQFAIIAVIEVATVALLIMVMRAKQLSFESLGLKGKPKLDDARKVIGGYVVYLAFYLLSVILISTFVPSLNVDQEQQIGFRNASGNSLVFVFISLVILPPLVEELLTRGFLYTSLKQKVSKRSAVLLTSVLFAAAHLQAGSGAPLLWVAAIDTFVLSLVLIELKERSGGRLWAPIGLHMLKNFIAFYALFVLHIAK